MCWTCLSAKCATDSDDEYGETNTLIDIPPSPTTCNSTERWSISTTKFGLKKSEPAPAIAEVEEEPPPEEIKRKKYKSKSLPVCSIPSINISKFGKKKSVQYKNSVRNIIKVNKSNSLPTSELPKSDSYLSLSVTDAKDHLSNSNSSIEGEEIGSPERRIVGAITNAWTGFTVRDERLNEVFDETEELKETCNNFRSLSQKLKEKKAKKLKKSKIPF